MIVTYYSCYPHKQKGFRAAVVNAKDYTKKWSGDAIKLPFRLYKSARCVLNADVTEEYLVGACFDALDLPHWDRQDNSTEPYEDLGVRIYPTSHMYGCTNENDGIYSVNGHYYTINHSGDVARHDTWSDAFMTVYHEWGRHYLCGLNMGK